MGLPVRRAEPVRSSRACRAGWWRGRRGRAAPGPIGGRHRLRAGGSQPCAAGRAGRCRERRARRRSAGARGRGPPAGRCAGRPGLRGRRRDLPPRRAAPGGRVEPELERARGRAARSRRSAPCAPCRTPSPPAGRRRCRRRRGRPAPPPGRRSRRAARAWPRRAGPTGLPSSARAAAERIRSAASSARSTGGRLLCCFGEPSEAPASVGARPVRCSQAVKTRAAVARRASVVREQAEGLLLGQPGAQGPEVEVGDVRESEPVRVLEQRRDVTEVGPDGVAGEVALGDEVPLVLPEQPGEPLGEPRRARRPLPAHSPADRRAAAGPGP